MSDPIASAIGTMRLAIITLTEIHSRRASNDPLRVLIGKDIRHLGLAVDDLVAMQNREGKA